MKFLRYSMLFVAIAGLLTGGCAATGKALVDQYQTVNKTRYEGAVAVVLESRLDAKVSDNGKEMVYEGFTRTKLLERKALDCGAGKPNCRIQGGIAYEPGLSEVEFIRARTITPEGEVLEVDKKDISDRTDTSWKLPDEMDRYMVWQYKGAVPGAILEFHYRVRAKKIHGVPPHWFQDRDPVLVSSYKLDIPADYKIVYKAYNIEPEHVEKKIGNRIVHTWTARDVPALVDELDMIAPDDVIGKIIIATEKIYAYEDISSNTTVGSWEAWGQFMVDLYKEVQTVTPEIKAVADEIEKTAKTETDKLRAVWRWMNDNVRYVMRRSSEFDRGILPLSAHVICTKKYGDCKAMAGLISVLCREVGLKADPVKIGTRLQRGAVELDVPTAQSNHQIARVEADGKVYWLDATQRIMSYDTTPYNDQGVHVVVARPGKPFLDFIPVQPPESNLVTTKTVFLPVDGGAMEVEYENESLGNTAGGLRQYAFTYTPEKWDKWINHLVVGRYPQASILEQSHSGKEDANAPFGIKIKAKIPKALQPSGRGVSFEVKNLVEMDVAGYFEMPKRRHAVDLGRTVMRKHRYEIKIPEGMKPAGMPKNLSDDNEFIHVERLAQIENDRIVVEYTFKSKVIQVPADKYVGARKSYLSALDAGSFVLMFEPEKKKKSG